MSASWKYFAMRTLNMLLIIFIIAMIISAFFTSLNEENREALIERQVQMEIQKRDFNDPNRAYEYREERIQKLKKQYNIAGPRAKRIFYNGLNLMKLDLGKTERFTPSRMQAEQSISSVIMHYLPNTILLFTTSAILYTLLAIFLGLRLAQKAGSKLDKLVTTVAASSSSVPIWWAGLIFLAIFYYELGWYPRPDPIMPVIENVGYLGFITEILIKMSLPFLTIVLFKFGGRLWISRNIVTSVLEEDYIMAARSKGIPEKKVIYGHAMKTVAPPITTSAVLTLLTSFGGFLITEIVFAWPGIGYLLRRALHESSAYYTTQYKSVFEARLIMGIIFVLVVISVVGLYIVDIVCGILDPRVEVGSEFKRVK